MNASHKYIPFFALALLMAAVLFFIYPHYQYYIDPDGTAYLTIAKRYADGDWSKAINGYWSPWSCWLTAIIIKTGLDPIPASIIINALGAVGFLFITQSFFLRFDIVRILQWVLLATLGLFLCFAVFWQSFDDLWECFFLLVALRLMLAADFLYRPRLWVLLGIAGALAYFAKAYSLPFFILNIACCLFFLSKDNRRQWLKVTGVAVAAMIVCSIPWIFALHDKYGIWTTSTAGPLNTSWYLVGHQLYKPELKGLLPPAYPDSPYFWEDPYSVTGDTPHFWSSWYFFGRQLLKVVQNCYKLLESMLQLSVFFPLITLVAWLLLTSKKLKQLFTDDISVVALSFLLFPLGYLLVNFESRYIWYMLPLGMLMGALMLQKYAGRNLVYAGCAVTFLLYPAWQMYRLYDTGKEEYQWAQELRLRNIQGGFTGIVSPGKLIQSAARLAYFSGNPFYYLKAARITENDLVTEMRQYGIHYFFVYTYAANGFYMVPRKLEATGSRVTETDIGETNEIKVFKLN